MGCNLILMLVLRNPSSRPVGITLTGDKHKKALKKADTFLDEGMKSLEETETYKGGRSVTFWMEYSRALRQPPFGQ